MSKGEYNSWSVVEDRLIIELLENDKSPATCKELLAKHTADAIYMRTSKLRKDGRLGPSGYTSPQPWDDDDTRLIELHNKGIHPHKDPELLKRHGAWSIINRCTALRKKGILKRFVAQKEPVAPKKAAKAIYSAWTEDEDNRILCLLASGKKPHKDETLLTKRSERAIIIRCSRLRKRPTAPRYRHYGTYTEEETRLIIKLLRKGERPQFDPTLLRRHTAKGIECQCKKLREKGVLEGEESLEFREDVVPEERENVFEPVPTCSVILSSMVSPLQRKALIGNMFN